MNGKGQGMSEVTDSAAAKASATDDWLGYGVYADALWDRVRRALEMSVFEAARVR